ncbi:TraC family protein [Brucella pituitosa]|uniref:TraC family protein n=1 Tax=Brucella pituitosa TaxID=571256 RepID=UPI003F4A9866
MASKSSIIDIDTQIEKLREHRKLLIVKSADRSARAATKAGLAEMELSDEDIDRIFEKIAARFRKAPTKKTNGETTWPRKQTNGEIGAAAEAPHGN